MKPPLEHLIKFVQQPPVVCVLVLIGVLLLAEAILLWIAWNDRGATR